MAVSDLLPRMSENDWLKQLIGAMQRDGRRRGGLLRMLGWACWHDESINAPRKCPKCRQEISLPRSEPGFPDIVAVRGDTLYLIELKADAGRMSEPQTAWLEALRGVTQVRVAVFRPRDLDELMEKMA